VRCFRGKLEPAGRLSLFPEEFATFLLTEPRTRAAILDRHRKLLAPAYR
jgi:isocitrate dehydrogenase kinase/phosphatase